MRELLIYVATDDPARGLDPNIVRPGWIALGIVAALCVGVFLLAKSFARHTRKAAQPWDGERDGGLDVTPRRDGRADG